MIEEKYMRQCLELALQGYTHVAPNPMVGAVIVHNGEIIGSGYHQKFGEAHAEVNAINSVKDQKLLKEATIYVNLEPCSHYGKTPPCAKLLIDKGIKNVVVANTDPYPEVSGRGVSMLREAGIEVTIGVLEKEAWHLNREFFTFHTKQRPYVTLKWAQSNDGYIDRFRNDARTLPYHFSTDETILLRDKLRSAKAAILVGTSTALLDNPNLTTSVGGNPVRVLIDRDLKVPANYNIYNNAAKTIVFSEKEPETQDNAEHVVVPFSEKNNLLSPKIILKELYKRNLQTLLVEGGNKIHNSFIENDLWDDARIEVATNVNLKEGVKAPKITKVGSKIESKYGENMITYVERINYMEKTICELMEYSPI